MTTYRSLQGLIAMIRRVHSVPGRRRSGVYSIEGTRLVERALRAGAPLEAVLVAEQFARSADSRHRRLLDELAAAGCPVSVAPNDTLAKLTEGRDLGQILGLVTLPPRVRLSDLLSSRPSTNNEPHAVARRLFLAAVDIVDPGNVGALTRTAHAGGAAALLAVGKSDPYHPRATRISRGSIFKLPVVQYDTAGEMIDDLRGQSAAIVGTAAGGAIPLPRFHWPAQDTAILMGNEAEGLPAAVQAALDHAVTIPMPDGVDSYSVNAAAAIMLYAARQAIEATSQASFSRSN